MEPTKQIKRIEKLEEPYLDCSSGCGGASFSEVIIKINEIVDVLNGEPVLSGENGFIKLVRRMRENQKAYFKTRHQFYKDESIKLEKQVDAELARLGDNLFSGEEGAE